jgi:spermidine synthase
MWRGLAARKKKDMAEMPCRKPSKVRAIAGTQLRISVARGVALPLFLVSGAAGLVYEVTWTRAFGVVFGNTVFAVSTVLTAFMLGLALGSWLFGRIADRSIRPLLLYAVLELLVGAYALVFPTILASTDIFYRWFFRSYRPTFYPLSLVRFVLSVLIVLVPTALMGGTLPVLSRLWAVSSSKEPGGTRIGQSVGLLYAVNTFGAVAGSFLTGYLLLELLGVSRTIFLAAFANISVGLLALALHVLTGRRQAGAENGSALKPAKGTALPEVGKERLVVLLAVAMAGFCALALEVLWTRVLVFVLETTAYAFACMLTCFILGLAAGSFLCSRLLLPRIKNPVRALGLVEFLVGLSALGSVPLLGMLGRIDYLMTRRVPVTSFWREAAIHFLDASVILLVPTVLMGMVFPIAVAICARSWRTVSRSVGTVYACNTVGCVVGSFAAGFLMVPLVGLRDSFMVVVGVQFFLAVVVLFFSERHGMIPGVCAATVSAVLLGAAIFSFGRDVFLRTMNTYHYPSKIIYIKDDATGTVTVHDLPDGDRLIAVDGVDVAGVDLMLRTTQKLQAYAPLLVHAHPKKVLQIGFGSGETSGVGLAFGVEQYSIVEICPGVFEAGKFFENINRGSYKDPRLRKIIMDGKNFVKLTDETFDVIMNDSTYPGTTGSSALYTYDHFRQCREHLNPGGVLSCWVPLDLRPEDFAIIVRSFRAAMPHCSLWMVNNCLNKHAVLLGTLDPMRIDFQHVKKLVERPDILADLTQIDICSVYEFLDCFVVGAEGLQKIGGDGPLNTDDRPALEFGAAIKRDNDGCWLAILQAMSQNHSAVSETLVNLGAAQPQIQHVKATLTRYFAGTGHALRGLVAMLRGDPDAMNGEFTAALKANPEDRDVASCLDELRGDVKSLQEAVEHMPQQPSLQLRLAAKYFLLRDYEHAVVHYSRLVALEPGNVGGWNNLGICYNRLGQFDRAIWAFGNAIKCDPQCVPAYLNLARAAEKRGDLPAASQTLEKAASVSSGLEKIDAYDKLARLYFLQKKYDRALKTLEKAIGLVSNDSRLLDYLHTRRELVLRAAQGAEDANDY